MSDALFVGLDVSGTSTRVLVASAEVHLAGDGAAAAVWLAAREHPGTDPVALHATLLAAGR